MEVINIPIVVKPQHFQLNSRVYHHCHSFICIVLLFNSLFFLNICSPYLIKYQNIRVHNCFVLFGLLVLFQCSSQFPLFSSMILSCCLSPLFLFKTFVDLMKHKYNMVSIVMRRRSWIFSSLALISLAVIGEPATNFLFQRFRIGLLLLLSTDT